MFYLRIYAITDDAVENPKSVNQKYFQKYYERC